MKTERSEKIALKKFPFCFILTDKLKKVTHKEKYFLVKTALHPKAVEALIGAAAGAVGGGVIGAGGAALIPHKFDVADRDFEMMLPSGKKMKGTGTKNKGRPGYQASYKRDWKRQGLRTAILGALIGGSRPWVEPPIRNLLRQQISEPEGSDAVATFMNRK